MVSDLTTGENIVPNTEPFPSPDLPLSVMEQHVFGRDAKRHPITCQPLESGLGANPPDQQAAAHIALIATTYGKAKADEIRKKSLAARQGAA